MTRVPASTEFDREAAVVDAQIAAGFRVAVIGSTSFWHDESAPTCSEIGERLAGIHGLVLLTGGVTGVGERTGRAYLKTCLALGRTPNVIHVLPRGSDAWDYGTTLFAGEDMKERREILGRLAKTFLVIEGGPGTEHEATVAAAHGALLVAVGRSGGHAGNLYRDGQRPPFVDERTWATLGDPQATPRMVATAVAGIVESCSRARS
jgi:hypothetical protein